MVYDFTWLSFKIAFISVKPWQGRPYGNMIHQKSRNQAPAGVPGW